MRRQTPIKSINRELKAARKQEAIKALENEIHSAIAYMFSKKPGFIQKAVLNFFTSLVARSTEFSVVIGPRREVEKGVFQHPTYHLGFNNIRDRHFCDFKLKLIKETYFKMTFPLPRENFFDTILRGFAFSEQHQSSGNYATLKLYQNLSRKDCDYLAKVADDVRIYYL